MATFVSISSLRFNPGNSDACDSEIFEKNAENRKIMGVIPVQTSNSPIQTDTTCSRVELSPTHSTATYAASTCGDNKEDVMTQALAFKNEVQSNEIEAALKTLRKKDEYIAALTQSTEKLSFETSVLLDKIKYYNDRAVRDVKRMDSFVEEKLSLETLISELRCKKDDIEKDLGMMMQLDSFNVPNISTTSSPHVFSFKSPGKSPSFRKLNNFVAMSSEDCYSPLSKTPIFRKATDRERAFSNHSFCNDSARSSPSRNSISAILPKPDEILESSCADVTESIMNDINVFEEFLKIELGELYIPNKIFSNFTLFQVRLARRKVEHDEKVQALRQLFDVQLVDKDQELQYILTENESLKTSCIGLRNKIAMLRAKS